MYKPIFTFTVTQARVIARVLIQPHVQAVLVSFEKLRFTRHPAEVCVKGKKGGACAPPKHSPAPLNATRPVVRVAFPRSLIKLNLEFFKKWWTSFGTCHCW